MVGRQLIVILGQFHFIFTVEDGESEAVHEIGPEKYQLMEKVAYFVVMFSRSSATNATGQGLTPKQG